MILDSTESDTKTIKIKALVDLLISSHDQLSFISGSKSFPNLTVRNF